MQIDAAKFQPTAEDRTLARNIYKKFSRMEECVHMASQSALTWLGATLSYFQPRRVLEIGHGIGTITDFLLTHSAGIEQIVATETHPYCIDVLPKNLSRPNDSRLKVVTDADAFRALRFKADLIVGDGYSLVQGKVPEDRYYMDECLTASDNTVIFAEGARREFRETVAGHLHDRQLDVTFAQYGTPFFPYKWKMKRLRTFLGFSVSRYHIRVPKLLRHETGGCFIGVIRSAAALAPRLSKKAV